MSTHQSRKVSNSASLESFVHTRHCRPNPCDLHPPSGVLVKRDQVLDLLVIPQALFHFRPLPPWPGDVRRRFLTGSIKVLHVVGDRSARDHVDTVSRKPLGSKKGGAKRLNLLDPIPKAPMVILLVLIRSDRLFFLQNHFISNDPHHDISIICFHAMVRSMLPWS